VSSPVNILLVDDEVRNLEALESLLQSADYRLIRAATAERALLLLLDGEFAAIVLDIQMPGMTGIELANIIKKRKRTQHIPIIFLTAYFQEDKDVLEGYGIGAVDYLTKPVNPQILKSKIGVFVDLFRKTRALADSNAALELEVLQRQKAEQALLVANSELESRVQGRTADLVRANDELLAREKALRASEAQLRLVTDYAPVFITQLDRQHRFKFVNRTYARRFGFEPQDLIGRHFTEVMGEAPYAAIRHHIEAALRGERVEFEMEIPYASLGPRWVFVIHEPERAASGEVVGLVAVIADITERKLSEQDVASARDDAMSASRAKDDFLATLSHELRTPLNPVLLLATEAAANSELPREVREDFDTIAKNVALEARLIDDLLDLTRIVRGKVALEMRSFDVHECLRDALAMTRDEIEQKKIELTLRLDAEHRMIHGDDVRLKQVFWNVVKNAAKFTPTDGRIAIESRALADGRMLAVSVTDTGIGLLPEELERIFEAFSQGNHARQESHRFGGMGLGLAISRMMVQLHSGSITASSRGRNQGSTFLIKLPLQQAGAPTETGPEKSPPTGERTRRVPGRSCQILLVEDHKPTARALVQLLVRRNHHVVAAHCVAEARSAVRRQDFDLLISDIGLPDGNGYELMAELREQNGLTGIALTGYGMAEDVSRSKAAGFLAHLTKPVSAQSLDAALARASSAATRQPHA
jgi:PAS domain S-box-containing protein